MKKPIKPKVLKAGDILAIAAPSSSFEKEPFLRGVEKLKSLGFKVMFQEDIFATRRYLAGTDERRSQELIGYLTDPSIKAILTARGGYGAGRILNKLDAAQSQFSPKVLLGYSDFTSILNYFGQMLGWVTFQGPCLAKDFDQLSPRGLESLVQALTSTKPLGEISAPELITIHPGTAEGILVGGCLSLITCTLGTPYQINTQNKILYLEDVGEKPYSIDRMLLQLRQAGLFDELRGIVFGPLKDTHHDLNYVTDLLKEWVADLPIPIVFNFPSGHVTDSLTIPFGINTRLNATKPSLTFLEGALES